VCARAVPELRTAQWSPSLRRLQPPRLQREASAARGAVLFLGAPAAHADEGCLSPFRASLPKTHRSLPSCRAARAHRLPHATTRVSRRDGLRGSAANMVRRKHACSACECPRSSRCRARAIDATRLRAQMGMFGGGGGGVFDASFRAYPVSFIDKARAPWAAAPPPAPRLSRARVAPLRSRTWRTATKARPQRLPCCNARHAASRV
jgi:hypothetical protein